MDLNQIGPASFDYVGGADRRRVGRKKVWRKILPLQIYFLIQFSNFIKTFKIYT